MRNFDFLNGFSRVNKALYAVGYVLGICLNLYLGTVLVPKYYESGLVVIAFFLSLFFLVQITLGVINLPKLLNRIKLNA